MGQKYTVYYKKKCLVINNIKPEELILVDKSVKQLSSEIKEISQKLLSSDDPKLKIKWKVRNIHQVFEIFKKDFKYIEAAGGYIINEHGNVLMINRFDVWDLPKGKIEKDETPAEAAKREVSEECGIPFPNIVCELPATYHIYEQNNKWILKKTFWFLMKGEAHWSLKPQLEEGIIDLKWMNALERKHLTRRTYPSVGDLLKFHNKALKLLK